MATTNKRARGWQTSFTRLCITGLIDRVVNNIITEFATIDRGLQHSERFILNSTTTAGTAQPKGPGQFITNTIDGRIIDNHIIGGSLCNIKLPGRRIKIGLASTPHLRKAKTSIVYAAERPYIDAVVDAIDNIKLFTIDHRRQTFRCVQLAEQTTDWTQSDLAQQSTSQWIYIDTRRWRRCWNSNIKFITIDEQLLRTVGTSTSNKCSSGEIKCLNIIITGGTGITAANKQLRCGTVGNNTMRSSQFAITSRLIHMETKRDDQDVRIEHLLSVNTYCAITTHRSNHRSGS